METDISKLAAQKYSGPVLRLCLALSGKGERGETLEAYAGDPVPDMDSVMASFGAWRQSAHDVADMAEAAGMLADVEEATVGVLEDVYEDGEPVSGRVVATARFSGDELREAML